MKSKKMKVLFLLFYIFSLLSLVLSVSAKPPSKLFQTQDESTIEVVQISIYNATYGDFDGDLNEDDVECYVDISFHQGINRKKFEMYTYLYLPNGEMYVYGLMVNTFRFDMTFHFIFYNHAYVSGYYTITVELLLAQKGNHYATDTEIFDPPTEEEPDSEPFFSFSLS